MNGRILLFAATTGYQVHSFSEAARKLDVELVLATDRCHVLDDPWGDQAVPMRFDDLVAKRGPFDGIAAVGDGPALAAARMAEKLGLRFHSAEAVAAASNKLSTRERFKAHGLLTPDFALNREPAHYPCVLKPLGLSASRGVIRANNQTEFREAVARIRKIIEHEPEQSILVEEFIRGREFALEGMVSGGKLRVLAIFDKPAPLDGPFFEETMYITPSRQPVEAQCAIGNAAQQAVSALGLSDGPVHAEMRLNDRGVWMLEVAARPIGGLCSRVLRFAPDISLEELILRHALGQSVLPFPLCPGAHGVMMIPIPRTGIFRRADGVEEARGVPGIESIEITAKEGQELLALPEGASYLGFIFARGEDPAAVETALTAAHGKLKIEFMRTLPVVK